MKLITFCFCKDQDQHFGLVREFVKGMLLVTFDDGDRWCKPVDLTFI